MTQTLIVLQEVVDWDQETNFRAELKVKFFRKVNGATIAWDPAITPIIVCVTAGETWLIVLQEAYNLISSRFWDPDVRISGLKLDYGV